MRRLLSSTALGKLCCEETMDELLAFMAHINSFSHEKKARVLFSSLGDDGNFRVLWLLGKEELYDCESSPLCRYADRGGFPRDRIS